MRQTLPLLLLATACVTGPTRKGPSDWEIVADDVVQLIPDPSVDTLYVRAHGRLGRFAPPDAIAQTPAISGLDASTDVVILPTRALRTREGSGPWQGWVRPPGIPDDARPTALAMDLPEVAIIDGVLVATPLIGPNWGVPRPVALLDSPAKQAESPSTVANPPPAAPPLGTDAVAAIRGIYALVSSSEGVIAIDRATDYSRSFQHGTPVFPAISSDGLLGAAALGTVPLQANVSGQPPIPSEAIGVFEGPKPIAAYAIRARPVQLAFAAGSLFALLPDRTLWKHGLDPVPKARATPQEQAILRHRDGLLVGIREALDAEDVARASDLLDILYLDALMDVPGDAAELAKEVREKARPLFEKAVKQAIDEQAHDWALVLDRRLKLVDGRGAGADYLRPPTLELAVRVAGDARWKPAEVDELFTKHPEYERVERCRPFADRAPTNVCLELGLANAPPAAPGVVKAAAKRVLDLQEGCPESTGVELVGNPPQSALSCEATQATSEAIDAFAATLLAAEAGTLELKTNAGPAYTFAVPRVPNGVAGLERFVSTALDVQIQQDSRASDTGAATRVIRALVWGDPTSESLRRAVGADAKLRAGPKPLGPSKSVDGGTPNP